MLAPIHVVRCAAEATRKAMMEAEIELLHPVMRVEVSVEGDDVGGVMTDLSGVRQGTVFGVDNVSNSLQVKKNQISRKSKCFYKRIFFKTS